MLPSFSALLKLLLLAKVYEAPRSRRLAPDDLEEAPQPLPALEPPNTGVYSTSDQAGSQGVCARAVHDFRQRNYQLCRRLRELINDQDRTYERWSSNVVVSWGARLCSDPELPRDTGEYDSCDAALFCRVTTNLDPCPQSLLQEHINHVRFRMRCDSLKVFLTGSQPDTVAGCFTRAEIETFQEAERVKDQQDLLSKYPDSKVFESGGKFVYAKPAPYIQSRSSCLDYRGASK